MRQRTPREKGLERLAEYVSALASALPSVLVGVLLVLPGSPAVGQVTSGPLLFEVASVKVSIAGDPAIYSSGGPGSADPETIQRHNVPLRTILGVALGMIPDNRLETPRWIYTSRYDIIAKVQAGTTKEQANAMMLNLLTERFHLKMHREMREANGFELTIAKSGLKVKETAYPDAPLGSNSIIKNVENNFPEVEPGFTALATRLYSGRLFAVARNQPARSFIYLALGGLGGDSNIQIVDKTGLMGNYDYSLQMGVPSRASSSDPPGGPDVFEAFEKQLGLKLQKARVVFEVVVVDSADKVPTEN
jgi:uncharacterized protein (TIGR03435 family)